MSEQAQHEASKTASRTLDANIAAGCGAHSDASTNVSQTHVPQQMTASSVPPAETGKWCCEVCTYENFPLSRKCTMCRAAKPLLGEDIFRLQDGASALPAQPSPPTTPTTPTATDNAGPDAVAERLRPLRISSPQAQPGASALAKWACPTCTYENWPKALKCAMCGAGGPLPPGAPPPASPPPLATPTQDALAAVEVSAEEGLEEAAARRSKRRQHADWLWLQACLGVVEGRGRSVEAFLRSGGDPARALTSQEVALLNRASAFDAGHTLVHLAIRFQRQEILAKLLEAISGQPPCVKRSPSYVAPDLAAAIRRQLAGALRTRKGGLPARYLAEFCTFALPAEIEELPAAIQEQLFCEVADREAQQALEAEPALINWSSSLARLGSRLVALWNRSAGDCLPDALAQAAYGVFDRHNALRGALRDTLHEPHAHRAFYARWQAWERFQASLLQYAPEEAQLRAEWGRLVAAAGRPGTPLHQLHVFALAHVVRRPIIVYGVNVINSFRGEALGYARFQGVYLPLLWEREFCSKSPLCLGYTRGHFSALVPVEPYSQRSQYICREQPGEEAEEVIYLPLTDCEGKLLPVHFLTCDEMSDAEGVLRRWVSACVAGGVLAARQPLPARPLLVAQMLEEWLNHYRRLAQQTRGPFPPRLAAPADFSSDADTDDE